MILFKDTKFLIVSSSFDDDFWEFLSKITAYPINNKDQKFWLLKEFNLGLSNKIEQQNSIKKIIYIKDNNYTEIENLGLKSLKRGGV